MPHANDDLANATLLTFTGGSAAVDGDTTGDTYETDEPTYLGAGYVEPSRWYKFQAPYDCKIRVTGSGSGASDHPFLEPFIDDATPTFATLARLPSGEFFGDGTQTPPAWVTPDWIASGDWVYMWVGTYDIGGGEVVTSLTVEISPAPGLYGCLGGSSTTSDLYSVDAGTGATTAIGPMGVAVTGLAFDPTSLILYAVTNGNSLVNPRWLYRINPFTGAATAIGALGRSVADIACDSSGNLYGWAEGPDDLCSINKTTGAATLVGNSGLITFGDGMDFDGDDALFACLSGTNGGLYLVNVLTGGVSFVASISGEVASGDALSAGAFADDGTFYVIENFNPECYLHTLDAGTGVLTLVGQTDDNIDALAAWPRPEPTPPAPPQDLWASCADDDTGVSTNLYRVDSTTGALTLLGAIGRYVAALAFDPTDGKLYGVTANWDPIDPSSLFEIDKVTAAATLIGVLDNGYGDFQVGDIAFDATGQLYAWDGSTEDLYSVDKTDGSCVEQGPNFYGGYDFGTDFSFDGRLWVFPQGDFEVWMANKTNGRTRLVRALSGQPTTDGGVVGAAFTELGYLFVVIKWWDDPSDPKERWLARVNPDSGVITTIAQLADSEIDSLASWPRITVDQPLPASPGPDPPSNDDFPGTNIGNASYGPVTWNNYDATAQVGEPAHAGVAAKSSVWFTWTASGTGLVTLTIDQSVLSSFDNAEKNITDGRVAVYTGASLGALTEVVSAQGVGSADIVVSFMAVMGTVYRIVVDSDQQAF